MIPFLLIWAGGALAAPFTFELTNHSGTDWEAGVAAVMPGDVSPSALLEVGATPTSGPGFDTYTYIDASCDPSGEDDGDASLLISRWGLTQGVDAWVVPALAAGSSVQVSIDAQPGDVLSFVARVSGSGDDVAMMHAVGDTSDTTIDLFNHIGLPLFNVRFDVGGYDPNSTSSTSGNAASCNPDCPTTGGNCFVSLDNGTIGADAGGNQVLPADPDFGIFPDFSLTPSGWYQNGIGSPSVVYRKLYGDFIMVFESKLSNPDAVCASGTWGIGAAYSTDGFNWFVYPAPVVGPTPGTFYDCVAAHPNLILDDNGSDVHLYFKGEQQTNACAGGALPWGCGRYTGVGWKKFSGFTGNVLDESSSPVVAQGTAFGFPSVSKIDGTYYMMLATYPSMYMATATSAGGPWTLDPTPVQEPGVTSWSDTEVFNPSLVCEHDAGGGSFPFKNFFGGRTRNGRWGPVLDGGLGESISDNAVDWFIGTTPFTFNDDSSWRHWDTVRVGSEYLIWFSEKDASGRNNVGLAASSDEWDEDDISPNICPAPFWW